MPDRPITFSAPMVRALLDGRKTQTRRLYHGGKIHQAVGDRLYVREHWKTSAALDPFAPRDMKSDVSVLTLADNAVHTKAFRPPWGRHRQAMHMPRWASRLTLTVTDVRVQRLNEITEEDALAEGVTKHPNGGFWVPGVEHEIKDFPYLSRSTARGMFAALWDTIHGSGEWLNDFWIYALTFTVEKRNIDA